MRTAKLTRLETGDHGTFGRLVTDSGFSCATGELPWRDNERKRSCIPAGVYRCTWRKSSNFGWCYHVEGVAVPWHPDWRTEILIHVGNYCGDKALGFRADVLGCILVGTATGYLDEQRALVQSKRAFHELEAAMDREPFELTIV
jgi:hypothetical protein